MKPDHPTAQPRGRWIEIAGGVRGERADWLAERLLEAGALAVDIADANADAVTEQPLFGEPGAEVEERWQVSRVAALFDALIEPDDLVELWQSLQDSAAGSTAPELRLVAETDWVRATQAQFAPIRVSDRLWIVPSWCDPPDPAAINLSIDPGLAFGSGTHATTGLCLEWLCRQPLRQARVLDYGTGSGVLALAARALGASRVHGVDIDPQAVETAQRNAVINGLVAESLTFAGADEPVPGEWDVVVANILAGPLTVLAPALCQLVAVGGSIALSGILEAQIDRIRSAYAPWIDLRVAAQRDGWVLMTGCRTESTSP